MDVGLAQVELAGLRASTLSVTRVTARGEANEPSSGPGSDHPPSTHPQSLTAPFPHTFSSPDMDDDMMDDEYPSQGGYQNMDDGVSRGTKL